MTSGKETSWERATHDVALDPCHFSPLVSCLALPKGGDSSSPLLLLLTPACPGSSSPQLFTSTSCPWRLVHGVVLPPLLSPWFTTSTSIHLEARLHHPQLCKEKASIHIQMVIHLHPKSTSIAFLLHPATLDPCSRRKILSARARRNLERLCPSEESKNTWDPGPNPRSTLYPIMTRPVGPVAQIHRHWFSSWSTMLRPSGQKLHDSS
ncbi:hypothetical protein CMEL01_10644 [Colletotrichum melonis]|uniref:Uncharacterized protein n=1 Tax=Colletotrichum melonis TaxID=1209925 RepID=A0AAI9TX38_9PEZI|nr:hypothetical protein CMEL01_10644 [Colletotrichum melonis]